MILATLGLALLGGALGLIVPSTAMAIAIAIAWMLSVANLLALAFDDAGDYLPGRILTPVANGGGEPSCLVAFAVGVVYAAVASALGAVVFARRDLGG